jgi:hypothetical protein
MMKALIAETTFPPVVTDKPRSGGIFGNFGQSSGGVSRMAHFAAGDAGAKS